MSTVGSSETVLRILTGMEQTEVELTESLHQMRLDTNSAQRVLQREQAWRLSYERFSGHMRKEYPLYCDLLAPLLAATAQVNSSCSCTYISAVPFMLFDFVLKKIFAYIVILLSCFPSRCCMVWRKLLVLFVRHFISEFSC